MLPTRVLLYGKDEPLPERIPLRAGPLNLIWEAGDLRSIKLGEIEIVRRIYVAVRDRDWGTAPPVMANLAMEVGADAFHIVFDVTNRGQADIDFTWRGEITGEPHGTIRFSMDGVAQNTFLRNRIGFCILHPDHIAGTRARVAHIDGSSEEGRLPTRLVHTQPVLPFAEMTGMTHEVEPGVWAELRFTGDTFEMEDQRNWTDASYKTFCTPLRLPYPMEVTAGTRIAQAVTLTLRVQRAATVKAEVATDEATFTLNRHALPMPLPQIGLGMASHGAPLSPTEIIRLRALHPAHLRVDLTLSDAGYPARFLQAAREAAALGAAVEAALFVSPEHAAAQFAALSATDAETLSHVARWLVYPERESFGGGTPLVEVLEPARHALPGYSRAPILSGTNADFIFLARSVPPLDLVDGLTFAITPQVHAFDNASIVETLGTQGQAVANAQALAGGRPVFVSPITLKMRYNAYATGPVAPTPAGQLPPQVDPRQMSLLLAGWTAASIKHIAEAGATGVTYYETTGWRGVMETASGAPLPEQFRSIPDGVFPVYHVLADVGEFSAGTIIASRSSDPLAFDGLVLCRSEEVRVILANLTAETRTVIVRGLHGVAALRVLDAGNAETAMREPEACRVAPMTHQVIPATGLPVELSPYAMLHIDAH